MNIWFYAGALALDLICAFYAKRKGRNPVFWFVVALIITPVLSGLILLFLKNTDSENTKGSGDLGAAFAAVSIGMIYMASLTSSHGIGRSAPQGDVSAAMVESPADVQPEETQSRFTVTNLTLTKDEDGALNVSGVLTNNTSKQYSYVQIEMNVYDQGGTQLGSDMVNVNNLDANGRWKFNTSLMQTNAYSVKIEKISAF